MEQNRTYSKKFNKSSNDSDRSKRNENPFVEKLISLRRVTKVVKGGRKLSFSALMIVGDGNGSVGIGLGKAGDVLEAIKKGSARAKKSMVRVPLKKGNVLPHEIRYHYKSTTLYIKPGAPGTGLIAGGAVRSLLEALGVKNVISKIFGSSNPLNVSLATLKALQDITPVLELAQRRDINLKDFWS